jgi:26S proteasome regulatory subunit N10
VTIPPSSKLLSDQLIATPILLGEGAAAGAAGFGGGAGGGGAGGDGFGEFGFDEAGADDPELALALRMSMEEEKVRQEKKAKEEAEAAKKASLETVKEGDEAAEPLLDEAGQPSGESKADKKDDNDKMDTS